MVGLVESAEFWSLHTVALHTKGVKYRPLMPQTNLDTCLKASTGRFMTQGCLPVKKSVDSRARSCVVFQGGSPHRESSLKDYGFVPDSSNDLHEEMVVALHVP